MAFTTRVHAPHVFQFLFLVLVCSITAAIAKGGGPAKLNSLEYPVPALRAGIEGQVTLNCVILPTGKVGAVHIIDGPKILAEAAAENISDWEFEATPSTPSPRHLVMIYRFQIEAAVDDGRAAPSFRFESPNIVTVTALRPLAAP
jgi:TonB family protein